MRRGKGFRTIERPRDIRGILLPDGGLPCCALLECLTTLCANEMFSPAGINDPSDRIISGLKALSERVDKLVIVTNEVSADGIEYSGETMDYIRIMSRLNSTVAGLADVVIECVCGIPLVLKGAL